MNELKHAIIVGHPDPDSFTMRAAHRYLEIVTGLGHSGVLRDLYRIDFDPRLQISELPDRPSWRTEPEVKAEREKIADADVFALIFPLWFDMSPSVLNGYVERIFGAGFGYAQLRSGGLQPLLTGRELISISASGTSSALLTEKGVADAGDLFRTYFSTVCGLRTRPRIHLDAQPSDQRNWRDANLYRLETTLGAWYPTAARPPEEL